MRPALGHHAHPARGDGLSAARRSRDALRARLLTALTGEPDGAPAWVRELAEGDDAGLFPEHGAAWTVHAGMATLVAGIRALLLQALHPGAMAGVHDWSAYRSDPLGRLAGTVRWVICVTYGSSDQARREIARVARLHGRVQGTYVDGVGSTAAYRADDPELAAWVHLAFTDAFLSSQLLWGGRRGRIPGGPDAYVREWAVAGRLMGVTSPPETAAELRAQLQARFERGELRGDERVREVVAFLRRPPLPGATGLGYRVLFEAAVASLPRRCRALLGVRRSPLPVIALARVVLRIAERALASGGGRRAPDWARLRLARIGADRAAPRAGERG